MRGRVWAVLFAALAQCHWAAGAAAVTSSIEGRLSVPSSGGGGAAWPLAESKVVLTADSGESLSAHVRRSGAFAFPAVPPGTYLMDVYTMGLIFPQYRVDVSAKRRDQAVVTVLAGAQQTLEQPLQLLPLGSASYYLPRKKADLKSYLMSPYGLMIAFAAFALIVLPMMKLDPEEMKKMQEEMKDTPLSGFLGGGAGASAPQPAAVTAGPGSNAKKKHR